MVNIFYFPQTKYHIIAIPIIDKLIISTEQHAQKRPNPTICYNKIQQGLW